MDSFFFLGGGSYQLISTEKFSVESIFEIFGVERFQRRLIEFVAAEYYHSADYF